MVEALVAITVLLIGVIGPITLLANSITNANYAKNQITAFFLAQEGQEMIINARNNNRLRGDTNPDPSANDGSYWLSGNGLRKCNPDSGEGADTCYIDTSEVIGNEEDKFHGCSDNGCPPLKIDPASGFYGYGNGTTSIFTRTIQINPINESGLVNRAKVTVIVVWQQKNLSRDFILESIIYRQYEKFF